MRWVVISFDEMRVVRAIRGSALKKRSTGIQEVRG
jgi:hypothetical protein